MSEIDVYEAWRVRELRGAEAAADKENTTPDQAAHLAAQQVIKSTIQRRFKTFRRSQGPALADAAAGQRRPGPAPARQSTGALCPPLCSRAIQNCNPVSRPQSCTCSGPD